MYLSPRLNTTLSKPPERSKYQAQQAHVPFLKHWIYYGTSLVHANRIHRAWFKTFWARLCWPSDPPSTRLHTIPQPHARAVLHKILGRSNGLQLMYL